MPRKYYRRRRRRYASHYPRQPYFITRYVQPEAQVPPTRLQKLETAETEASKVLSIGKLVGAGVGGLVTGATATSAYLAPKWTAKRQADHEVRKQAGTDQSKGENIRETVSTAARIVSTTKDAISETVIPKKVPKEKRRFNWGDFKGNKTHEVYKVPHPVTNEWTDLILPYKEIPKDESGWDAYLKAHPQFKGQTAPNKLTQAEVDTFIGKSARLVETYVPQAVGKMIGFY